MKSSMITKIISGRQTDTDQTALDFAMQHNIPHGGWIPKGRKTEDGILPDKYQLQEIPMVSYPKRTEKNILDSDGTLIFSLGKLTGGSALTRRLAKKNNRSWLKILRVVIFGFIFIFHFNFPASANPESKWEPKPEEYVLAQVKNGELADLKTQFKKESNRILKAQFLQRLLTGSIPDLEATENGVKIRGARLKENLYIISNKISFPISLTECIFDKSIYFLGTKFSKDAPFSFSNSKFFGKYSDFSGAEFFGNAVFTGAEFSGETSFTGAEFSGETSFSGVAFSGETSFLNAEFSGDASFLNAEFSGKRTDFGGAEFSGKRTDFDGAKFSGKRTNFRGAKFSKGKTSFLSAEFSGETSFNSVTFSGETYFGLAKFSGDASFDSGTMIKADYYGADLRNVSLRYANLRKASFMSANLCRSDLSWADLNGVDFFEAKLGDCLLWGVKNFPSNYNPKAGSPPYIPSMADIPNLSKLTFDQLPHGLMDLREGFKKLGYREQERKLTYAIKRTQRQNLWNDSGKHEENAETHINILNKLESIFYQVFFELTCAYGMKPGRPLLLLVGLIFFFTMPYAEILSRKGDDGIWKVWIKERVREDIGTNRPKRLYFLGVQALKTGFYFSLVSAFSIGWRELNVGNWIARIQRREYVLRATGWARVISGIQSLISVYLLALWALTYFGRPFEAV